MFSYTVIADVDITKKIRFKNQHAFVHNEVTFTFNEIMPIKLSYIVKLI